MGSWRQFSREQPELAKQGAELLYRFGVGLAYLATVRGDGAPRVHPVCPVLAYDGLYTFVIPSPKQQDLHRDGRYALHSFPMEENEDAFYLTGSARHVSDPEVRKRLGQRFVEERSGAVETPAQDHHLFELEVETAMLTRTTGHGDFAPRHTIWHAKA